MRIGSLVIHLTFEIENWKLQSMQNNISATRMNLLVLKNQASLARQGVDLLKRKRDALVMEFFNVVKLTLQSREDLSKETSHAYESLVLTEAIEGTHAAQSIAMASNRSIQVENTLRNVWGVKVPEFQAEDWTRNPLERGCSPSSLSARMQDTALSFEKLTSLLVKIASIETRLRRLGAEIKKTTRRVNALEQIIVPTMNAQIRFIRGVIEQREREDTFRLKKIKLKLERKKKA
ncbi:MAG: V-type ATP synthase subunit D [Chlamydiae bacterium]|nr:V-type ATP synthase subunit D [Chlamydiota bacterium]MBI3266828.1 V-type ATP synthase subunit D [Chlamydiota bacterium]